MERSHTPLSVWFWAAYLVASQTPGMSAVQFQRQLGLSRYETAFQILHKLRSGMVRPNQDRIGGQPKNHVEVDETWVGGRTRGEGRGVHHKDWRQTRAGRSGIFRPDGFGVLRRSWMPGRCGYRDGSSEVSERIDTTVAAPRACSKYEIRVYDVDAEIMGTRYCG